MTSFLDAVKPFTTKQWPDKERDISNWIKVSKLIYSTEDKNLILQYLQLELVTRSRPMIINRIYSRFSYLRNTDEYNDITKTFPAVVKTNAAFIDILTSWDYTVDYLESVDFNEQNEIMVLMQYEWAHKRRPYLLKRLLTRYQSIRRKQELREMYTWNLKRTPSDTLKAV